jgi:hypothetical protein
MPDHRWRTRRRIRRLLAPVAAVIAVASVGAPRALAIEPSGTFIQVTGSPAIYRVIGGAAIHVDSCAPLNGCPGIVQLSSLKGYASKPSNGSYLRYANGPNVGWVGVFVGGTPIHVDSCAPLNNCPGTVNIDAGGADDYIAAHPTPANGSYIHYANGPKVGWVGRFIGGTPIHVDSCAPLSGCPGEVNIDAGGADDYIAAHPTPPNGSFLRYANGPKAGWIGVFIGGTPIHVDSCAPLNNCPGTVDMDAGGADDYIAVRPTPANGSFVLVADGPDAGEMTRSAGGALIPVTDCSALGGCGGYVTMDSGGFSDYTHVHPVPADGTVLLGVPSASTWEVLAGQRVAVAPSQAAVALNDASIAAIPVASPGSSGAGTQHLRRLHVKLSLRWRWNRGRTQLVHIAVLKGRRRFKVRMSCSGAGCPRQAIVARSTHGLRPLEGRVYRAGDRIIIRVSAPGRSPERGLVVIRYGRKPRAKSLG